MAVAEHLYICMCVCYDRRRHSIHGGMDDLDSSHDDKPSGGSSAVLGRLDSRSSLAAEDGVAPSNGGASGKGMAGSLLVTR